MDSHRPNTAKHRGAHDYTNAYGYRITARRSSNNTRCRTAWLYGEILALLRVKMTDPLRFLCLVRNDKQQTASRGESVICLYGFELKRQGDAFIASA
jgi:hypothetical protein